jgi:hypothetical protein
MLILPKNRFAVDQGIGTGRSQISLEVPGPAEATAALGGNLPGDVTVDS